MHQEHPDNQSTERLLETGDDKYDHVNHSCKCRSRRRNHQLKFRIAFIAYGILLLLYIAQWVHWGVSKTTLPSWEPGHWPSLRKAQIFQQEDRTFSLTPGESIFSGPPSEKLETAWHDLLQDATIRVDARDLQYYNVTSLPLADGSGYGSEMFVMHELHCLKMIRQYTYRDHYFADVHGLDANEMRRHVDHCIETIRQGIMCRGDVSLSTFTYIDGTSDLTSRTWGSHKCVDFDALKEWTKQHTVDVFQPGVLVKPRDLGPEHFTPKEEPH